MRAPTIIRSVTAAFPSMRDESSRYNANDSLIPIHIESPESVCLKAGFLFAEPRSVPQAEQFLSDPHSPLTIGWNVNDGIDGHANSPLLPQTKLMRAQTGSKTGFEIGLQQRVIPRRVAANHLSADAKAMPIGVGPLPIVIGDKTVLLPFCPVCKDVNRAKPFNNQGKCCPSATCRRQKG